MMKPLHGLAVLVSTALIGCQSPAPTTSLTIATGAVATLTPTATISSVRTERPPQTPTSTPGAPPVPAGLTFESPIAPGEALDLPTMHIQVSRMLRGAEAASRLPQDKRERWLPHDGWEWVYVEFTHSGWCRNPAPTPTPQPPGSDEPYDEQPYCPSADSIIVGDRSGIAFPSHGHFDSHGDIGLYTGENIMSLQDTVAYMVAVPPDADLAYVIFPFIYADEVPTLPGQVPQRRYFDAVFLLEPDIPFILPEMDSVNAVGTSPDQPAELNEPVITASWAIQLTQILRGQDAAQFAQDNDYESPYRNTPNLVATFELVRQTRPGVWQPEAVPEFYYTQSDSVDHQIVNPYNRFGLDSIWSSNAFPGATLTYVLVTHVDESRGPVVLHANWYQTELEPGAVTNFLDRSFVGAP